MNHKHPLYACVPTWITRLVETKKCYKCKTKVTRKNICAIGIRTCGSNQNTVYVEHLCSNCDKRTVTSFSKEKLGSVEELCYMLVEQIHSNNKLTKARKLEQNHEGSIEDEEVESLVSFMDNAESFEDLLKYIGSPQLPPGVKRKDES